MGDISLHVKRFFAGQAKISNQATNRLTPGDLSPILFRMADPYEQALKKLAADERSLNELSKLTGIPAETLRDIKSGHVENPRFDTLKKLVGLYARAA